MISFYRYCVTFYDEAEGREITRTGITTANSYSEATAHLGTYYGDDNIMRFMCECIGADEVYECETQYLNPKFY